jgi:hypothetical protein
MENPQSLPNQEPEQAAFNAYEQAISMLPNRYGTARDGATSVLGIHYSRQPRSSLAGAAYGTGLKGAEAGRLAGADPRLSNRVHFYVDTGNGIRPEAGVGGNVHAVYLDNLYDASVDPLGLRAQADAMGRDDAGMWFNAVESAIIDAGFDGVYIPVRQRRSRRGRASWPATHSRTGRTAWDALDPCRKPVFAPCWGQAALCHAHP